MALLTIKDLSIGYQTPRGQLKAVEGVSFSLEAGQSLGLVGESGCGKTTIGMALMGLLPENGRVSGGSILLEGRDLVTTPEDEMRKIRWSQVAMIFQAAMNALNPVQRVCDQMAEAILVHRPEVGRREAMERVAELFDLVDLDRARMRDYPHQYSGGMKQRAIIAMALANQPRLIIADEPTTALDVVVQDQILEEIKRLQGKLNLGIIFISHDISIVEQMCHFIGVMYAGQLVESGTAREVFERPMHPYTQALIDSFPTLTGDKRLNPIPGEPPDLVGEIPGCRFCDRCPKPESSCRLEPPAWQEITPTHHVLCDHCEDY